MALDRDVLGLDSDDAVDVVYALEDAFGIKITDDEAVACQTVGDVISLISRKAPEREGACLTSMAFYRLRQALSDALPRRSMSPAMDLLPLAGRNPKAFLKGLNRKTLLAMPPAEARWMTAVGALLVLGGLFVAPLVGGVLESSWTWPVAAGLVALGAALCLLDPCALPTGATSLGGLARWVAELNYGRLVADGGAVRPDELRAAVTAILAGIVDRPPSEIRPDMRLLAERRIA